MMHFIAFSFEAASVGNLIPSNKNASHQSVNALLNIDGKGAPYRASCHILSLCVVISNKFPRLLAEREIIANAYVITSGFLPRFCRKNTYFF